MFRLLAQQVLPPERVVLVRGSVAAEQVHLVLGQPPFSPLFHQWPRGVIARMRPRVALGAKAPQPALLFLPRQRGHGAAGDSPNVRRARAGVRTLSNVDAVLRISAEMARPAGLRLQVYEFTGRLSAQRRAFQRARVIAGAHGGAWSGLAFAQSHVAIIEWSYLRDAWSIAEYLELNASYFQLMPRWRFDPGVPDCNRSGSMDDCPWEAPIDDYRALLHMLLHHGGSGATAAMAEGARAGPRVRTKSEVRDALAASRASSGGERFLR